VQGRIALLGKPHGGPPVQVAAPAVQQGRVYCISDQCVPELELLGVWAHQVMLHQSTRVAARTFDEMPQP
jgi:hypothetical protein